MYITRKMTAFLTAAVTIFSVSAFSVYAEEELESDEEYALQEEGSSVSDGDHKVCGDYRYSVKTGNYGDKVAVLEYYDGNDTEVVIPETVDGYKVEALSNRTFADNNRITSITIPSGLEDFGIYSFYGCTSITEFKVSENNELYKADSDGALVGIHGLSIVAYPVGKKPVSYTVPDGVVLINASAFAMCEDLKEITFPDSLETIGDFAFSECTSLEKITLPDNLTELNRFAFSGCSSLKELELNDKLTTIGDAAFFKCESLKMVSFPDSVHQIGQAAFCATGLTSVKIPASVSSIGYSAFGFSTDLTNQIIQDESFVIQGYKDSYAERYCSENDIIFSELEEEETEPSSTEKEEKNSSKKKIAPGAAVGICVVVIAALTGIVLAVCKKKKNNDDTEAESDDDNTEDNE